MGREKIVNTDTTHNYANQTAIQYVSACIIGGAEGTLKLLWQLSDWKYWQLQSPVSLCSTLHGDRLHNFLWNVETKSSTRPTCVPRISEEKKEVKMKPLLVFCLSCDS